MWLQETGAQTSQYLYKYLVEFNGKLYQVLSEQLPGLSLKSLWPCTNISTLKHKSPTSGTNSLPSCQSSLSMLSTQIVLAVNLLSLICLVASIFMVNATLISLSRFFWLRVVFGDDSGGNNQVTLPGKNTSFSMKIGFRSSLLNTGCKIVLWRW